LFFGLEEAFTYFNTRSYIEPIFAVVIMTLCSTRPIVKLAEKGVQKTANLFGGGLLSWWFTILTLGPLFGSLITEVAAMTLCAMLLASRFFIYRPSKKFAYATLGILFVNISVGGLLTNFASPPVLIIARTWQWDIAFMFQTFGWKVV